MNALYDKGREAFLGGDIDFASDTINMALLSDAYTPDLSADQVFSDISSFVVGTPQALASKTVTGGVADCGDVTYTSVLSGSTVAYVALYKDTGVPGTSTLIAVYDTADGLPFATTGADVSVVIDNGGNRLFKL